MDDVVFDPSNKDTKFFIGDTHDWAIQDDKCFSVSYKGNIGYAPNKHPLEVDYEGTEATRKEFAKMYPQIGL